MYINTNNYTRDFRRIKATELRWNTKFVRRRKNST